MLVLSRKRDQEIVLEIGGVPVRIVVVEVREHVVHIGIEAPRSVPIWRAELHAEAVKASGEGE
jgi:carbon storage regulator